LFTQPTRGSIGWDKAYGADLLEQQPKDEYGVEMMSPNRRHRSITHDRPKSRRYTKQWKGERFFAWTHNSASSSPKESASYVILI
jgi:hypothetical protein